MRAHLSISAWILLATGCGDAQSVLGTTHHSSDPSATAQTSATTGAPSVSSDPTNAEDCHVPSEEEFWISQPLSAEDELFNQLLPSQLNVLYEVIGRYMNGEVPIYQGPFEATERYSDVVKTAIDSPRALAALRTPGRGANGSPSQDRELFVFDEGSQSMLRIYQSAHVTSPTDVSPIGSFYSTGGTSTGCSNCLTVLALAQDSFEMDLTARGTYLDDTEVTVDIQGSFERIPAAELTLDDLLTVNSTFDSPSFGRRATPTIEGDVFIFERRGTVQTEASEDSEGCYETVDYQLEWFVRRDCLKDYGPRNLVTETPRVVCPSTEG